MARLPVMGAVKTRLAREAGATAATFFYRHAARVVILRLARDRRWRTLLAVTPDHAVAAPVWPRGIARVPQGRGDLGRRMQRLLELARPGPLLVIGTDIPGVRADDIARAFRRLAGHDAVLGPAEDGGYWLVGLRRVPRVLRPFERVRWSSADALADTLANLAGRRVARAALHADVDDAASLKRLAPLGARVVMAARSSADAWRAGQACC